MRAGLAVLALSLLAWQDATPEEFVDGRATYYRPGLMEEVATNRGLSLAGYYSGVALNRAGDLGRTVWLTWGSGERTGPHLVVDCAQAAHFLEREERGYVVEVDAELAGEMEFYGLGPVAVRVWFAPPAGRGTAARAR